MHFLFVAALNIICQDALFLRAIWRRNLESGLLLPLYISSLLGVDDSHLGGGGRGAFPGGFFLAIFFSHQKAMISVIKFHLVDGLDELHGVNFFALIFYMFRIVV